MKAFVLIDNRLHQMKIVRIIFDIKQRMRRCISSTGRAVARLIVDNISLFDLLATQRNIDPEMAAPALFTLEADMPTQLFYYLLGNAETDAGAVDLPEFMPQALVSL